MTPSVYLAGPITGQSYSGANTWREMVADALNPSIRTFSPMRGKHWLVGAQSIPDSATTHGQQLLSTQAAITARDRNDCRTVDAILFNFLGAEKVSIGTCIELGWGDAFRKPMVLLMEPEQNIHEHSMIRQLCGWRCSTLEEAAAVLKAILLP